MTDIRYILVLLAGVVLTNWMGRVLGDRVALPLIQVAVGAAIGSVTSLGAPLKPDQFFLIFLPPLLFFDGWRVSKTDLAANAPLILSMALGLVVATVGCVGLMLHWLIPAMPLAVCFALAAVLSPTDVVAAGAVARHIPIPRGVLRLLEGEALFNDAAALICLRLAIAAVVTGTVPVLDSLAAFVWAAGGGIAIGIAFSWMVATAKAFMVRRVGEDTSGQILISLLIPYGAYLLAEAAGSSAVLAAVAAGMMMSRIEVSGRALPLTRLRRSAVWETLQFTLNGVMFLLLGEQMPGILSGAARSIAEGGHHALGWLGLYVAATVLALAALRFAWVLAALCCWPVGWRQSGAPRPIPRWRLVAVMAFGGVRGAVTLAAALSLPLVLTGGVTFPARDLAVFIAAAVILVSLALANVALPILLRGIDVPPDVADAAQEREARAEALQAALAALAETDETQTAGADTPTVAVLVADYYRHRLDQLQAEGVDGGTAAWPEERRMHLLAIQAERRSIVGFVQRRRIPIDLAHKLLRETDAEEVALPVAPGMADG
ncbi:Na+/H+ antiporter [Xanthobacter aminoxidans]|uniref:Na+/H+ antiporter n=1 Tax=Xanthobacter aminoxidans TaxID=186280 RepID=UPI00372BE6A2